MQVSNAFLLLHISGFLFKWLLQSAHAFRSRVVLQNRASCCCCGAHRWALGPLNAQLHVTLTPALGILSPQFLCLCMECWKPGSDYLQDRFSMPNKYTLYYLEGPSSNRIVDPFWWVLDHVPWDLSSRCWIQSRPCPKEPLGPPTVGLESFYHPGCPSLNLYVNPFFKPLWERAGG